jgi:uncharacterized protein YjdB
VATLTLITPTDSILGTAQLVSTVVLRDAFSNILTGRPVAYTSSNPAAATVSPAGVITGVAPGTTTITATAEGRSDNVVIDVLQGINTIALTPATDSIIGSGTANLTATATDINSAPVPGRLLTVTSSNPAAATVTPTAPTATNAGGAVALVVTAVAPGQTTLNVQGEGKTATRVFRVLAPVATVTVTTPGDSVIGTGQLQATATTRAGNGAVLTGRPVTWQVAPGGTATISLSSTGLVTGITPGTVSIVATSEGVVSTPHPLRILAPVNTVTVTAADSSVYVTQTQQANALLQALGGATLTGRPIAWSSDDPAVATVGPTGLITAVGVGTATITATAEGKSGSLPFSVSLVPAHTVTVTPSTPSLVEDSVHTFTAVVRDTAGNVLTGRTITWSSSSPGKLSIDAATGTATAIDSGSATITATTSPGTGPGNSASGTATATVTLGPVTSVVIVPNAETLGVGQQKQLRVEARRAGGLPARGRSCTIQSSNSLVVLVSPASGVTDSSGNLTITITGVTPLNTATITATCEGLAGTSVITT